MITFTAHLWVLYAVAITCCLIGFGFGACAMLGPEPLPAREEEQEPGSAVPGLPRAGRFTLVADPPPAPAPPPPGWHDTVPMNVILMSDHYALLDHTGREADRLDAAWRHRYLR